MLPGGNTPEALYKQIFSDSLATQNSNSRLGSASGRLGPGQASCLSWAFFLLYSMSGRGRTLNFITAPLALKISILRLGRVCPKRVGYGPPIAALQREEGRERGVQRAQ